MVHGCVVNQIPAGLALHCPWPVVCVFMERSVLVGCNMQSYWGIEKSLYKE